MNAKEEVMTVTIGVFSGRPNPTFDLEGARADELASLLSRVIGVDTANPPPAAQLGVYYGFLVQPRADAQGRRAAGRRFTVYRGVVTTGDDKQPQHWRDGAGVESFLAERAAEAGFGSLLREAGAQISAPKELPR